MKLVFRISEDGSEIYMACLWYIYVVKNSVLVFKLCMQISKPKNIKTTYSQILQPYTSTQV
jgi:hypothetical protein